MLYRPDNDNPRLSITVIHELNNMLHRSKAPESVEKVRRPCARCRFSPE